MIDAEWELVGLGEAIEFLDSQRRPVKVGDRDKVRGVIPYYGASGVVDYVNNHLFDEDLILLGEDGENILSRVVPLAFKISGKAWVNNHAHVLRPRNEFDIDFLTAYLESLDYADLNSGTAQPKLNKQSCLTIRVPRPPLMDQRRIARAISDIDGHAASLKRLIAKKRDVKKGMMQELLTGRTRLPGFTGEWRKEKLGAVATMGSGGTPPSSVARYYGGGIPWASISDMTKVGKYISVTETTLTEDGLNASAARLYEPDSVLYAMYASLGECSLALGRVASSQAILGIMVSSKLDREFLYYTLQHRKPQVKLLGQQGTQSNLNASMVRNFDLVIPPIEEQAAIAFVLKDADAEIEALEQRLESARAVKVGMMQELLTGRTRLPVEEEA